MRWTLRHALDCVVVTLAGLIPATVDGFTCEMAPPQRSDAAVTDDGDVTIVVERQQIIERRDDALLGVHGTLPSGNARFGVGEALIGQAFVLTDGHETGRR